jgi:TonB family protein
VSGWRRALAGVVSIAVVACGRQTPPQEEAGAPPTPPPDQEPPVALNPDSPIQYPPKLYDQKVEGDVVLRLFVDSTGRLAPESSRVAESSGYPALDSSALAGARKLRFAPARRRGVPMAAAFLQPIEFRHRGTEAAGGATGATGSPGAGGTTGATGGAGGGATRPAIATSRPDTSRVRRDTTRRPRPETAPPGMDTAPPRPDTSMALPETTWARPDTGGATH